MKKLVWHDQTDVAGSDITGVVKDYEELSSEAIGLLTTRVAYCVARARSWITTAEALEYAQVQNDLNDIFLSNTENTYQLVRRTIALVRAGLYRPVHIKFDDLGDDKQGLTRKSINPFSGQTRIYLNTKKLLAEEDVALWVLVYLHEATHLFANTNDHAYIDYSTMTYQRGITHEQALNNADSYAAFIYIVNARRGDVR